MSIAVLFGLIDFVVPILHIHEFWICFEALHYSIALNLLMLLCYDGHCTMYSSNVIPKLELSSTFAT